jgi:NAD(P)-dependent dehydrogenase (short-subunit alcohol dehydrogenase family)
MEPPIDTVTADGYDLQFGTNVIGHWLFTELLMPAILAASGSSTEKPRVVTVASAGAYLMGAVPVRNAPRRAGEAEALAGTAVLPEQVCECAGTSCKMKGAASDESPAGQCGRCA